MKMEQPNATTQPGVADQPAPDTRDLETRLGDAFHAADPSKPVPEAPKEAPPEPPKDEGPEIRTLSDLTKYLEAQEEDIMGLEVHINVDGQVSTKALKDVIRGYQLDQHNTQKSQQLSELRQKAEAEYKANQEASQRYLQQLDATFKYTQDVLNQDFANIPWDELKYSNPAEWTMRRQEFQERQARLNAAIAQTSQQSEQLQAQARERQQAKMVETVKAVQELRPEWRDMATFNKDCDSIKAAVLKVGLPPEDLPGILQHPAYLMIADAATKYFALQAAQPAVEKRVSTAPKFVKPGARQPIQPNSKAKEALSRLKANPKNQDAQAAAFQALLGD